MITLDSADILGHCVFCDEIRIENTGKFLYIGAYHGAMHVPSFPFVLPRLGIAVRYSQRPNAFLVPKIVMFLPGDPNDKPSIVVEFPEQVANEALANAENLRSSGLDPSNTYASLHMNFNFGQLPIPKSGVLKVRATREDKLFRLGSLLIEANPTSAGGLNSSV